MKNFAVIDLIFLALTTAFLLFINYLGHSELITRYIVIVILIAYYCGKVAGRMGIKSGKSS